MKRNVFRMLVVMMLAVVVTGCKKDGGNVKGIELERTEYVPYEVAQLNVTGVTLKSAKYFGLLNELEIDLDNFEGSLVFFVPELGAGDYLLTADIEGKTYEIPIKIKAAAPVSNPDAYIEEEIAAGEETLNQLNEALEALSIEDKALLEGDMAKIQSWIADLKTKYDGLSADEKQKAARAIAANKWWMDEMKEASNELFTALNSSNLRQAGFVEDYEASVKEAIDGYLKPLTKVVVYHIPKVVALTSAGALAGSVIPGLGTGVGAAIGLGAALGNLFYETEKTSIGVNKLMETCFRPFKNMFADNKRVAAKTYKNKKEAELGITMDYRSSYDKDRNDQIPMQSGFISATDAVSKGFDAINEYLPESLQYKPKTIDSKTTYNTENRAVHSNYITIDGISNNKVKASTRKAEGVVYVTFTTTEKTNQTFNYRVNYKTTDFGNQSYTVSAELEVEDDSTVTDIDGNVYNIVTIGTQVWMKENLKTTKYNDGVVIPNVTGQSQWDNLTSGAWCYYNNNSSYNEKYGKLYNFYTVSSEKLCPIGWHVPSGLEWKALLNYLGGEEIAGGKMKSTIDWKTPNVGANNSSGFTGYPAGERYYIVDEIGGFSGLGEITIWPGYSNNKNSIDFLIALEYDNNSAYYEEGDDLDLQELGSWGVSIRCVKD